MGRACSTHGERKAYWVFVGNPERKRPLRRPRHRWGVVLKLLLEKYDWVLWSELIWRRIGTKGGLL
jgi:hypothetical protein